MIDKVISLPEAATLVKSGAMLTLGGITLYRRPVAFVYELLRQANPPNGLTLMCFTASYESDLLIGAGLVKRIRTCYCGFEVFGLSPMFTEAGNTGQIEIMEESEASLTFGIRAAAASIGFMPGRGWIGTDMLRLRPDVRTIHDPYSGEELAAFPAINPDVAVIHALVADRSGNAVIGGNPGIDPELALVAKTVIITAEEIVEKLDRVDIATPLVTAVVAAPRGAWPTSCHPLYPIAGGEILQYLEACSRGEFRGYLEEKLESNSQIPKTKSQGPRTKDKG